MCLSLIVAYSSVMSDNVQHVVLMNGKPLDESNGSSGIALFHSVWIPGCFTELVVLSGRLTQLNYFDFFDRCVANRRRC